MTSRAVCGTLSQASGAGPPARVAGSAGVSGHATACAAALDAVGDIRAAGLRCAVQLSAEAQGDPDFAPRVIDGCRRRRVVTRLIGGGAVQLAACHLARPLELARARDAVGNAIAKPSGASRSVGQ